MCIKALLRWDYGVGFLENYSVQEEVRQRFLKPIRILEGSPSVKFGIGYFQRKYLSYVA